MFTEEISYQNTLSVKRLPESHIKEVLYVRSVIFDLLQFNWLISKGELSSLNYSLFNRVFRLLETTINFMFKLSDDHVINYDEYPETPDAYRQKLLKDFKVPSSLISDGRNSHGHHLLLFEEQRGAEKGGQ